jgi:thiamine-monophosphate kinase
MIDVSDGFARDLEHIVAASGVGCAVELESIPIDPAAGEVADLILPMEAALTGGEDLELIFTVAEEDLESIRQSWPEGAAPLTRVGTITTGQALIGEMTLDRWKERGWEHLRTR